MDETGVHSLLNAIRSTVPDLGTASPAQTVAGKDSSNPFMAVTLPKSEEEEKTNKLPVIFTAGSSSRTRSRKIKKKDKSKKENSPDIERMIKDTIEKMFREREVSQKSQSQEPEQITSRGTSSDREFLESNYVQDAQDPNDYDSGMSFDSIALYNLDT
ncbi:hypothetical protein RND71_005799 [Anisodus tanguticus]|uniref:Uncharacterized protein n=1 Tax=Anisodus tanguticus TaxID=243964 RepID=A0AAE1STU5_9SOLA|nr:hypothetical protein RND71_005799 [Anisodus tanguticus]